MIVHCLDCYPALKMPNLLHCCCYQEKRGMGTADCHQTLVRCGVSTALHHCVGNGIVLEHKRRCCIRASKNPVRKTLEVCNDDSKPCLLRVTAVLVELATVVGGERSALEPMSCLSCNSWYRTTWSIIIVKEVFVMSATICS